MKTWNISFDFDAEFTKNFFSESDKENIEERIKLTSLKRILSWFLKSFLFQFHCLNMKYSVESLSWGFCVLTSCWRLSSRWCKVNLWIYLEIDSDEIPSSCGLWNTASNKMKSPQNQMWRSSRCKISSAEKLVSPGSTAAVECSELLFV